MPRRYAVLYKNGKHQIVSGTIVFFSSINTEVPKPNNVVYLNADEVISVVEEHSPEKEG